MALPLTHPANQDSTILVIEDDLLVAEVIISMLEDEGYTVQSARSADEAMQILANRQFGLVLCDIGLPGMMDGLSLAKTLRLSNPSIRILLITGRGDMAVDAAMDFIVLKKPFGLVELARIVAWALRDGGSPYLEAGRPSARDLN